MHAELTCPIHSLHAAVVYVKGAAGTSLGMVILSLQLHRPCCKAFSLGVYRALNVGNSIKSGHDCGVTCVQAQAQSQAQAAAKDKGDVIRSPQDAAEAWRRHVYIEGLYAQPMGLFSLQC